DQAVTDENRRDRREQGADQGEGRDGDGHDGALLPSSRQRVVQMPDDIALEREATELLRTLIRNGCVNTGEAASGHEARSVEPLEDSFAGSGLSCERYTSEPGRTSLVTRIEGRDPRAPTLLLMG